MDSRPWRKGIARQQRRPAFTIVELLVSVAVIAFLVALLLPAVQAARESGRRAKCASNLKQLGIALQSYQQATGAFPPGIASGEFSFLVQTLPFIGQRTIYDAISLNYGAYDPRNHAISAMNVPEFLCPSDHGAYPLGMNAATDYAGNTGSGVQAFGYNGPFVMRCDRRVSPADVADGLSQTMAVAEILAGTKSLDLRRVIYNTPMGLSGPGQLDQFAEICRSMPAQAGGPAGVLTDVRGRPWTVGTFGFTLYNHVLPPNQPSCTNGQSLPEGAHSAASMHPNGANAVGLDGAVHFIPDDIDVRIWRAMGSRNGGEAVRF